VMLIAGTAVNAPQTLASRQLTPIHGLLADEYVALLSRQLWIFWAIVAAWGCTASSSPLDRFPLWLKSRHSAQENAMSALPPNADMVHHDRDVCFVPCALGLSHGSV